ncbi:hypothetical protein CBR_g29406 [Chara braunii]|uniref:Uncharacterized protein n=1 Tax=Chara braunii TaxID=69332 RepID=A0A388JWQ6_CHABU|nr:hypothetical protein CBR_g29406 [Chara braunii]|eukprot:GBG62208.1 hypothetical protein CBR_g29406 [Chara braunii]
MAGMQGRAGVGAGQGGIRAATAVRPIHVRPFAVVGDAAAPSDKEPETEELPTLPLASGSTQLWSQTVRAGGSGCNEGGEYTSLLQQGLGDDDDGGLDLRFGLCSGGSKEASRTLIIDTDPSPRGVEQGGSHRTDQTTLRARASVPASVGPSAVLRRQGSTAPSADRSTSNWPARNGAAAGSPRVECARPSMPERTTPTQSDVRDAGACRPLVRPVPTVENITRGVSNMRAHSDGGGDDGVGGDDADERLTEDVDAGREVCDVLVSGGTTATSEMQAGARDAPRRAGPQLRADADEGLEVGRHCKAHGERGETERRGRTHEEVGQSVPKLQEDTTISERKRAPPVPAAREEGAVVAMARDDARGEKRSDRAGGEAGSSRPRRGVLTNDLIDRAVLWVDDKPFWTTREGRRLYNIVHQTREYFVAITNGLPPPVIPRSVVMPKSSTRIARIADPSQLQQATSRASAVENITLLVLHGWVFKSGNRPRGYNLAFQYALESVATDIARAMWYGKEWCNVVSPAVCAHTIDLSMDLPLWFAGVKVENKPDDDDVAAYQESTIICVAHAFRAAVQMGVVIDGEFISHDRLCWVTDCFRLLLAACMWIMRMSGDDPRSHFEAFHFPTLVSKPTLVASMHRSFDHRRSIRLAMKAVTERLGKANATFGKHPDYLPHWADRDIVFGHDARIDGPEEAKKLDWLGSGPADDDNDDDDKGDA